MQLNIVVYSKSACPQCDNVKNLLKVKNIAFDEFRIDEEDQRQAFYESVGHQFGPCLRCSSMISVSAAWQGFRLPSPN